MDLPQLKLTHQMVLPLTRLMRYQYSMNVITPLYLHHSTMGLVWMHMMLRSGMT